MKKLCTFKFQTLFREKLCTRDVLSNFKPEGNYVLSREYGVVKKVICTFKPKIDTKGHVAVWNLKVHNFKARSGRMENIIVKNMEKDMKVQTALSHIHKTDMKVEWR